MLRIVSTCDSAANKDLAHKSKEPDETVSEWPDRGIQMFEARPTLNPRAMTGTGHAYCQHPLAWLHMGF